MNLVIRTKQDGYSFLAPLADGSDWVLKEDGTLDIHDSDGRITATYLNVIAAWEQA